MLTIKSAVVGFDPGLMPAIRTISGCASVLESRKKKLNKKASKVFMMVGFEGLMEIGRVIFYVIGLKNVAPEGATPSNQFTLQEYNRLRL